MSPFSFATEGDLLPLPSEALVFLVSVLTAVVTLHHVSLGAAVKS